MKLFLFLLLIISSFTWAQDDVIRVEKVHSIDYKDNEATVTFWDTNQVYRLPSNAKVMPCIDNAFKAEMEVALKMKKDAPAIEDCRLYNGGIPNF
jgi:hypothetical protein